MRRIIIFCSTVVLLAGCSIYKPYSRPEMKMETDSLYGQGVVVKDTASIATLPWTELFTDPMLQALIREGLASNTDLGIARLRVEEAEATLLSSRLAYLPSVSLTPQGGLSSYDGAKTSKTYTLAASAEWEIDLFGRLTNAKRGARAALESSRAYSQAEQSLAQAFYAANAARSAFYPSITLSGSAGWTNSAGVVISNPGSWLLSAIGSLTQPLFNRGRTLVNLRIAKAQQEEALLSFRQSLLKAGNEVNDALMQWQTADERLKIIGEQVESLQSAVDNTRRLMEYSSSSSYLEVLTARQNLLQAELTEANDRFDKIQGVINLYHALGGGDQ